MSRPLLPLALLTLVFAVGSTACGSGGSDTEEINEYLFTCPLTALNGTTHQIVQYEWVLIEEKTAGDIVWATLGRGFGEAWMPGMEMVVVPGPSYADAPYEPDLVWIVTFVDSADNRYEYTVRHLDCEGTYITIEPGDAI